MHESELVLGTLKDQLERAVRLPHSCITEKFDVMGQSGGGKTYLAMKLAELMSSIGGQFVVLDPTGVWKGLRRGAAPGLRGLSVVLMGGQDGDVPLSPDAGALVAGVVVGRRLSAVLDLSEMLEDELNRFVTDFIDRFFHLKKTTDKSPVHLFFEECQEFIPEDLPTKGAHRMRASCVRLMKIGRNYGIGWTAITQEPQAASKRALNQAGTIIAVRTIGRNERDAIAATARSRAKSKEQLGLIDALPDLATGEAIIWSPSFLKVAGVLHVAKRITYDSSKTPEVGERRPPAGELGQVDMDLLRGAMAAQLEQQRATDPTALQTRVRDLEAQLATAQASRREVPVLGAQERDALLDLRALGSLFQDKLEGLYQGVVSRLPDPPVPSALRVGPQVQEPSERFWPMVAVSEFKRDFGGPSKETHEPAAVLVPGEWGLTPGEGKYLVQVLTTLADRHPMAVTRGQLAVLAGRSGRSSAFDKTMARLKKFDLVTSTQGGFVPSAAGWSYLGRSPSAKSQNPEQLRRQWLAALPAYERGLLEELVRVYPKPLGRPELASAAGRSEASSAFDKSVARLKKNGLVDQQGALLYASGLLFAKGAA